MAANEQPRRVSMSWVLGLSKNGPFKDGNPPPPPQPRKPSKCVNLISTPGAMLEWAASDGRRHAVSRKGKIKTSTALASVPETSKEAEAKAPSQKAASEVGLGDIFGAMGGDDNDKNETKDSSKQEVKKNDKGGKNNTLGFSEEDDAKLLELKNSDAGLSWADIAKELGKEQGKVKGRWGQIKPKDWKAPKKSAGGDKKDKGKGEKEKKEEAASGDATNTWGNGDWGGASGEEKKGDDTKTGDAWGSGDWNNDSGGDKKEGDDLGFGGGWGATDTSKEADNTWDAKSYNGSKKSGSNSGNAWNNSGGGNNTWDAPGGNSWDNTEKKDEKADQKDKDTRDDAGGGWDNTGWGGAAPASKAGSTKHSTKDKDKDKDKHHSTHSHTGSKKSGHRRHSHSRAKPAHGAPKDIRLYPDGTFSASDLKQIARILHQDRATLWERLAYRFSDKTGRRLPPEAFENKFRRDAEREAKKTG